MWTITRTESQCSVDPEDSRTPAGRVQVTAVNKTNTPVTFDIWRIADEATYAQLAAHIDEENDLAEAGQEGLGPPAFVGELTRLEVGAGVSRSTMATMRSGTYAVVSIRTLEQAGMRPFAIVGPLAVE